MVTELQVVDTVAELLDDASRFVTECHWHRARSITIDDGQIGMTQPCRHDLYEHLPRTRRRKFQFFDLQRNKSVPALSVRLLSAVLR